MCRLAIRSANSRTPFIRCQKRCASEILLKGKTYSKFRTALSDSKGQFFVFTVAFQLFSLTYKKESLNCFYFFS